jgi:diaminopimelate decarboxylase
LCLVGLHVHVGSQLLELGPILQATRVVAEMAIRLSAAGLRLDHLDLGGGIGIPYDGGQSVDVASYARSVLNIVEPTGLIAVVEPGRWVVGPAGVLVTRVVDTKPRESGRYVVVVDAGMSELMRPALYGARHRLQFVAPRSTPAVQCDVVGPICETSDVLAADCRMPLPEVGDIVVVRDAGAYGSAMASNYNRHPLPAEVLVDDGDWRVIRRRQDIDDMLAMEM